MAMEINKENFILRNRKGETLVKKPGSINGYDFVIDTLEDCNIYILDHTAQVQIDDCINCKIFIGPVGGSAFFRDCKDCRIEVACQQLRTRDCERLDIGLYCSTKPIIESSTEIYFKCWGGAYFGLTQHFAATGLDPEVNDWYGHVYDFNPNDDYDGKMHFQVNKDARIEFWEVAVYDDDGEPLGAYENPVPLPDGTRYSSAPEPPPVPSGQTDADSEDEKQDDEDSKENEERAEIQAKAAAYLSAFYQERAQAKQKRIAQRKATQSDERESAGSSEENSWARIISLIDFTFSISKTSSGADMDAFKSALFAAKNNLKHSSVLEKKP